MQKPTVNIVSTLLIAGILSGCATTSSYQAAPVEVRPEILALQGYTLGVDSRESVTVVEDVVREALKSDRDSKIIAAELTMALHLTGTGLDAKRVMCQQLWLVAQPGNVPSIAKLLNHAETADMARYAIERIDHLVVDNQLLYYLNQGPENAKPGIINSLAIRGSEAAREPIEAYLNHRNSAISAAAKAAVAKLPAKE
jgi:hypothetical protein